MRRSELQVAVRDEFGALGQVLLDDLSLGQLGGRTGTEALQAGADARSVWLALCEAQNVPEERRHGAGRRSPRR